MTIPIIIPAYNAGPFLGQTLSSLVSQTIGDWEVVIVDDGSTDDTADIASNYAKNDSRIRLLCQGNGGLAAARNRGMSEISLAAERVIFLDADDVCEPEALEILTATLDATPSAVAAYGLARSITADGAPFRPGVLESWSRQRVGVKGRNLVAWRMSEPTTLSVLAYQNVIATPGTVLIKCEALRAAGAFDPAMSPCEDWDMWLRLCCLGEMAFANRVVLNYRVHVGGMSRDGQKMRQGMYSVRIKCLRSIPMTVEQHKSVWMANWYWTLGICVMEIQEAKMCVRERRVRDACRQLRSAAWHYVVAVRGLPAP
jgi:glycosyltransferase involved in cell wall biosynthesis